jgi:signal transduction histidine kinase
MFAVEPLETTCNLLVCLGRIGRTEMRRKSRTRAQVAADWLAGGGEMGKLVRSMDWSKTPLGPIESWPQSLRTTVSLCLASNFPISLAWGPKHIQIYNDGYWPICGGKHPYSMGQDFSECWASAWPAIGGAFERALAGETTYLENQRMYLDRNGYLEETFFTFSFSPIRDESGGVGGLFHPVTEMTARMLSERRARALRDLAARTGEAQNADDVFTIAVRTLGAYQLDLPFLLIYTIADDGKTARLAANCGLAAGTVASPEIVDLTDSRIWALDRVVASGSPVELEQVEQELAGIACGAYPEPPRTAYSLAITPPGAERPAAVLVAGVSPRLPFTDIYHVYLEQMALVLTAALANAQAYQEEKRRAERLAEIDRAKTVFFSNVSHEFRTPLTLILGPLADELAEHDQPLPPHRRERIEAAYRNSLRMLKLVNTLLDFARIEAGRIQAVYEATDLSAFTAELAGNFRSACERAGLRLIVDCPPLPEPVYVDREMWEKIVLNLVSNAFKFTLQGEIAISLKLQGDSVQLVVRDTGVGIPAEEVPHIYQRFHRVKGAQGRTHEGTGIGLALVQDLVEMHGGSIRTESALGEGSAFIVTLPRGSAHLPAEGIGAVRLLASTALGAKPFVEEALRWLPSAGAAQESAEPSPLEQVSAATAEPPLGGPSAEAASGTRPRVLWADDNADMRDYVQRLLSERYDVEAVADGQEALEAAFREAPDLVLSDVMMPRLDGFGLCANFALTSVPAPFPSSCFPHAPARSPGSRGSRLGRTTISLSRSPPANSSPWWAPKYAWRSCGMKPKSCGLCTRTSRDCASSLSSSNNAWRRRPWRSGRPRSCWSSALKIWRGTRENCRK